MQASAPAALRNTNRAVGLPFVTDTKSASLSPDFIFSLVVVPHPSSSPQASAAQVILVFISYTYLKDCFLGEQRYCFHREIKPPGAEIVGPRRGYGPGRTKKAAGLHSSTAIRMIFLTKPVSRFYDYNYAKIVFPRLFSMPAGSNWRAARRRRPPQKKPPDFAARRFTQFSK
jgi:hypothetical protein